MVLIFGAHRCVNFSWTEHHTYDALKQSRDKYQ